MYSMGMGSDWRRRHTMFDPSYYSIENYCTDTKKDMKHSFGDELLNNLHLLPDPLKKNLADSIISSDEKPKQRNKTMLNMESVESMMPKAEEASPKPMASPLPTLSGITSFFSGVMNVISSAMFLRRPPSPPQYYDCYEESNVSRQASPVSWHPASGEDQNKNVRAHDSISNSESDLVSDMSKDCHDAAAQCEDKLNRLRLLLKSKPIETPNSCLTRPCKISLSPPPQKTVIEVGSVEKQSLNIKDIKDNLTFATEINGDDLSSVDNSPAIQSLDRLSNVSVNSQTDEKDYFDEISGKFHSTSATESEDSFQIVFTDSPQTRPRVHSDCESEDSFIVFEESPDSCYTSNDVFGDESVSDAEYSDSDVSDSGCVPLTKLAHPLSRTFGDLTDNSLYEDDPVDEVDCAVRTVCEEIPSEDLKDVGVSEVCETDNEVKSTGLLLNNEKKLLKKNLPPKKVHFSPDPPKVHVMRVWTFAARQARAGHWERCAIDRDRFKRRIADVDMAVSWVLKPQHRSRVMFQRFMPWWNAQKRKEIADRKQKEAEDKLRAEKEAEEERLRAEDAKARMNSEGNTVIENDRKIDCVKETVVNEIDIKDTKTVAKDTGNSEIRKKKLVKESPIFHDSTKKNNVKIDCKKAIDITNSDNLKIVAVNGNLDSKERKETLSGT